MNKYIILGGGIAGLATAIQLLKAGKKVALFEKNLASHSHGHAFILMPNGLNAIKKLGIYEAVLEKAHPVQEFQLNKPDGALSAHQKIEGAVGIRRGTLIELLKQSLPKNFIQYDKGFSHFEMDDKGIAKRAVFKDGTKVAGTVFIGADGIWSKTRGTIQDQVALAPVRIREIVSVVKSPQLVKEFRGTFIKIIRETGGVAVGMVPCDEEHLVWFIQYDSHHPLLLETTLAEQKERLFRLTRNWCHPIPALISKTDFDSAYTWHTTDMKPLSAFHKKNVVLVGDAAHVLLTLTSQGVSSALEDAICLSDMIIESKPETMEQKLNRYTLARKALMESHFHKGRALKEQFLFPMQRTQAMEIPLAFNPVSLPSVVGSK